MKITGFIRGLEEEDWSRIDPPLQFSKQLRRELRVPDDAVTYMLWAPQRTDEEQFRDARQAAAAVRRVLREYGVTESIVFAFFHVVDRRGSAAEKWLDEKVDEGGWWDQDVGWYSPGLQAAYLRGPDFQELTLVSWNLAGKELLEAVREALLPVPRVPVDDWFPEGKEFHP